MWTTKAFGLAALAAAAVVVPASRSQAANACDTLWVQRNAIYKVVFDARGKIRRALVANGYLGEPDAERR